MNGRLNSNNNNSSYGYNTEELARAKGEVIENLINYFNGDFKNEVISSDLREFINNLNQDLIRSLQTTNASPSQIVADVKPKLEEKLNNLLGQPVNSQLFTQDNNINFLRVAIDSLNDLTESLKSYEAQSPKNR